MVTPRHVSLKRYINTVLDQLPPLDEGENSISAVYTPEECAILGDFLTVLCKFEEADKQRNKLSNHFLEFKKKYDRTDQYLKIPFLWFSIDYFTNANIILRFADFNGTNFYEYLVKPLRRNPEGSFLEFVKQKVSLKDPAWEKLQYLCADIKIPLKKYQHQIIDLSYGFIQKYGILSLNQKLISKEISQELVLKVNKRELSLFYLLLDAQWTLWFYPPSMGLKNLYVTFHLTNEATLNDIFDFNDPNNTTLLNSRLYQVIETPKMITGHLTCPIDDINKLKAYISQCEKRELLKIHEMSEIIDLYRSASLALYQEDSQWRRALSTYLRRIIQQLMENPSRSTLEIPKFFLTQPFTKDWDYKRYPDPSQVIHTFCKADDIFNFSNLPYSPSDRDYLPDFSRSELSLLRYLYGKQVSQITLYFHTLLRIFSPDTYLIDITPSEPLDRLTKLLFWIPFGQVFFTESFNAKSTKIITILTPEIIQWLESRYEWDIQQISLTHYFKSSDYSWYNPETLKWRTPRCLDEPG